MSLIMPTAQILESPPSSSPGNSHFQFYSDGRPRPPPDEDNESRDSMDEGGYVTATLSNAACLFEDPHQPKLLLAEDPVEPMEEKRLLHNEFGKWTGNGPKPSWYVPWFAWMISGRGSTNG